MASSPTAFEFQTCSIDARVATPETFRVYWTEDFVAATTVAEGHKTLLQSATPECSGVQTFLIVSLQSNPIGCATSRGKPMKIAQGSNLI